MALAVAQVTGIGSVGPEDIIAAPSVTSTANSLIVVLGHTFNNTRAPVSGDVTDNKGNAYTLAVSNFGGAGAPGTGIWYTNGGSRGASHIVTFAMVGFLSACNIAVIEITGQDLTSAVFDTTTDATGTDATSPWDVVAAAAISGNQIAIYGVTLDTGTAVPFTEPGGYNVIFEQGDGTELVSDSAYKLNETGTPTVGATSTHVAAAAREVFATFYEAGSAPTFPTTGVLDTFTRADGNIDVGESRWSNSLFTGNEIPEIRTNAVINPGDFTTWADAWWNASTYGPDCEVFVTCNTPMNPDTDSVGLFARVQNPGVGGAVDNYQLNVSFGSPDTWRIYRGDNSSNTQLGASFTQDIAAGDSIGMSVVGDTITAWYKASAGSWTALAARTDATYSAAGYIGWVIKYDTLTGRWDNFGGGTVVEEGETTGTPNIPLSYMTWGGQ